MNQKEFNQRVAIHRDGWIQETIQRQLDRMDGKKVNFSTWRDDADYLALHANIPHTATRHLLKELQGETLDKHLSRLHEKQRNKAIRVRTTQIHAALPLTPWGFIVALIRAKRIQARQRKRNKRRKRKSAHK